MLHLFKKKHVLPTGAQTALDLVRTREGKKYTKHATKLYKLAGVPPTGRLQPRMLKDGGLWENAEKFLSVAIELQKEGFTEIECGGKDKESYCYMKVPESDKTTPSTPKVDPPPPYPQNSQKSPEVR
ncbi:hypothetical protein FKM82_020696 [Ascaphus truei]